MRGWAAIVGTLLSMTLFLVPMTQAAEEYAGRVVYHTLKVESKEVGDVPGHIQGSGQQAGLVVYYKGDLEGGMPWSPRNR